MIRFVDSSLTELFEEQIDTFGILSVKIYSQYKIYGAQSGIVDFWLAMEGADVTGAISKLDGFMTLVAAPNIDLDELSAFVWAVGGRSIDAELPLAEALGIALQLPVESSWVMCFPQQFQHTVENLHGEIALADRLRPIYELLCAADPQFGQSLPYDAWLSEASHKQRHGLADTYVLKVSEQVLSTCSIQFKGKTRSILAGVATAPTEQGNGYASRVVVHTACQSYKQGLTPYLLTSDDALAAFYRKCGFETVGRWGRLHIDGKNT